MAYNKNTNRKVVCEMACCGRPPSKDFSFKEHFISIGIIVLFIILIYVFKKVL